MYRNKVAALGGKGTDKSFEQTVADLAHDFLSDKAPTLMQSELGFQLLDKSDDDSRGVGVCVFRPNDILMFAPVFFLNGEVKGHELLYLPEQDMFVPLKEAWINELLGKKPALIGDSVDKSYLTRNGMRQPDMRLFKTPPKFASWVAPYMGHIREYAKSVGTSFSKTAALMVDSSKQLADATSLKRFFKYASARGLRKLDNLIKKSKLTKRAFEDFYPNVDLEKIARSKDNEARYKFMLQDTPNPNWVDELCKKGENRGFVQIISYSTTITTGTDFDLTEKEKEKLLRDQYIVIDKRPDADISIIEQKGTTLTNPTDTGIYSVLMADGTYKDIALVRITPFENFFFSNKNYEYLACELNGHTGHRVLNKDVFAAKKYNNDRFVRWFEQLPDCTDMSLLNHNGNINFLNKEGVCYGNITTFDVKRYGDIIRMNDDNVEIGNKITGKLRKIGGKLYVPEDCKIITRTIERSPFVFGTPEVIERAKSRTHENIKLAVANDWCKINDTTYPTKFAGFCALIKDYHLREKDAKNLFKQAEANAGEHYTTTVCIKKADSLLDENKLRDNSSLYFPVPEDSPASLLSGNIPAGPSGGSEVQADDSYYRYNEDPYRPDTLESFSVQLQQVQQALQSGQEEVFNLSVLKQFLNDGDLSSEIDKEIPELMRGMNHAGRMLFRYYWKGEKFKELYGPQEMPELESSLRRVFELLGDVILLLKHRLQKDDTYGELSKINLADIDE